MHSTNPTNKKLGQAEHLDRSRYLASKLEEITASDVSVQQGFMDHSVDRYLQHQDVTKVMEKGQGWLKTLSYIALYLCIFTLGAIFHSRLTNQTREMISDIVAATTLVGTLVGGGAFIRSELLKKQADTWEKMYRDTAEFNRYTESEIDKLYSQIRQQKVEHTEELAAAKAEREKAIETARIEFNGKIEKHEREYSDLTRQYSEIMSLNSEIQHEKRELVEEKTKLIRENAELLERVSHLESEVARLSTLLTKLERAAKKPVVKRPTVRKN